MSKIIASAAIRGAHKIVADAEKKWQHAMDKHGASEPVGFPNTAYYLPIIYGMTAMKVEKLGDMGAVLKKCREVLPPPVRESIHLPYLGPTLDAGMVTFWATECAEAIRYLEEPDFYLPTEDPTVDKLWLGAADDVIMRKRGVEFVDGSAPGFAAIVGAAPSPEIVGTLRFTNDRETPLLGTAVTISFSEDVFINDLGTVSLSIILRRQENMVVEAFDAFGAAVFATTYGTNTPGLVELDTDGDAAYRSRGLGAQRDSLYGDTFYTYTDSAVRSVRFTNFTTKPGRPEIHKGFSSQGIRNVDFAVVPEPSTAILLGLGLFALGSAGRLGSDERGTGKQLCAPRTSCRVAGGPVTCIRPR